MIAPLGPASSRAVDVAGTASCLFEGDHQLSSGDSEGQAPPAALTSVARILLGIGFLREFQ